MYQNKFFLFLLFYIISILGFSTASVATIQRQQKICKSLEITTPKDLEALRNCTVVVGYVRIVNLYLPTTKAVPASVLEEITDYLLVYRVYGLNTLQRIFPRLKIIRGQELFLDKYSLVVFENRELENIGLINLLRIQKGDVRIEHNPVLCYVETINWPYLLGNNTIQNIYFKNKPNHQCPMCNETYADIDYNDSENLHRHCWNLEAYQRNIIFGDLNCSQKCGIYGCGRNGECCSSRCLTGCSNRDCELCGSLNYNGLCVETCPLFYFQLNKRECVNQNTCIKNSLVPHSGICMESCPKHYERKNFTCILHCSGHFEIRSSKDISGLADCTSIRGNLVIELTEIKAKIVDNLESALKNIKEITGYLKIKNSPQLVSLQFLSNLHTIKGEELIDGKYSLYVVNNYHLENIWIQNVAILKGRIYFHLNPSLCYEKIIKLTSSVKTVQKILTPDVSPNSNGERVICGENVRILNAIVEDFNSTAVRIKVDPMSADDKEVLIGYAHYYKEAPNKNISRYDGRHGCGHDDWMMDISPNENVRHVISGLKPFTQYAYFVKTLTMTDYHTQLDAYSKISYFRTLPSKPGPVSKIYYHALSTTEIMVHWWPPHSPNGNIVTYLINYVKSNDTNSKVAATKYLPDNTVKNFEDICQCQMKQPFYSGPIPSDENYYSKEQIIYDEALPNFIYVSRIPDNKKPNNNNSSKTQSTKINSTQRKSAKQINVSRERESFNNDNASTTSKIMIESTTLSSSTTTVDDKISLAENSYRQYRKEVERKALAQQDTGIDDFPIIKTNSICDGKKVYSNFNDQNNAIHVAGHIYLYLINKLDPDVGYEISVRACLESGECGAETKVLAKTISKTLDDFIKSAQDFTNDIDD